MQISQLMERDQMTKYSIIYQLLNTENPITLKALKEKLALSAATLEKHILEMPEIQLGKERYLTISIESSYVHLRMDSAIQLNDIIAYFLEDSIKYQILTYLFKYHQFTIPILAHELMVSEATLNRNLSALNKCLTEFDIQIRNGRLRGSFHQIVYFYYHLYLLAWPYHKQRKIISNYRLESYLIYFEHINKQSFSTSGSHRLAFWLFISQTLATDEERYDDVLLDLFSEYQEKSFYLKFKRPLLQYHMRLATDFREGDLILDVVFLMSHRLLSPTINEQILGHGGQIMESVSLVLNRFNDLTHRSKYAKSGLLYEAGQTFSRMTFFKGAILSQPLSIINSEMDILADKLLQQIVNENMAIQLNDLGDLYPLMQKSWSARLEELHDTPIEELTVALRIDELALPARKIMKQLRNSLEIQRQIAIEWYKPDLQYDYLISDFPEEGDYLESTYYLKGEPAPYDLCHLKNILQHLLAEKA